jgi:outer membrane biogenesis lipoprotein LolB
VRLFTLFIFIVLSFMLFSCKQEIKKRENVTNDASAFIDSVYGSLSPLQQHQQHFILDISADYQYKMDSLLYWLNHHPPGGIHFIDWEYDSIQKLKTYWIQPS